jgi:hypothetical protein
MVMAVSVTVIERLGVLLDIFQVFQLSVLPYVLVIVLMKPFHVSIAFGMTDRAKDQLGTHR